MSSLPLTVSIFYFWAFGSSACSILRSFHLMLRRNLWKKWFELLKNNIAIVNELSAPMKKEAQTQQRWGGSRVFTSFYSVETDSERRTQESVQSPRAAGGGPSGSGSFMLRHLLSALSVSPVLFDPAETLVCGACSAKRELITAVF